MEKPQTTRLLASFAADHGLNLEPVLEVVLKGILDYIGLVSFAAQNVESSKAFFSAVESLSAPGIATVVGSTSQLQPQYAALLNGALAHSMDCDDTHIGAALHPGAPVISAALAQSESEKRRGVAISGRLFVEAVAVGYEVTCRLGNCLSATLHRAGFHPTGVLGAYGAAAAAGRIAGLNADQMETLFGLTGSVASGSMQYLDNGAWNKRLHPGFAAHHALLNVAMVLAGVVGATASIEGDFGLVKAYGRGKFDLLPITKDLGRVWEASNTAIKPYASCRLTHAAIDAVYKLRKDVHIGTDMHIQVRSSAKTYMIVGHPAATKVRPKSIVDAQFSIYYHVAVALLYGHNDWTAYRYLGDDAVQNLCSRITVAVDDTIPDESLLTTVQVGETSVTVEHPLGEPANAVAWDATRSKFNLMANAIYGEDKAKAIGDSIHSLIKMSDMTSFIQALRLAQNN